MPARTVTPLRPRTIDKRLQRPRSFYLRRATSFLRGLPDFIVIGEMKCATSSLFSALGDHPAINPPIRKETHFFTKGYHLGESWYRAHFPRRRTAGSKIGEATPDYLYASQAPARVKAMLPDAKFIVLLRDPVGRAISHYHHEVRMGRETLSIEQALAVEDTRMSEAVGQADEEETRLHASYADRGRYGASLQRWLAMFDADRFLVLETKDFQESQQMVLNRVANFLGISPFEGRPPERRRNAGSYDTPPESILSSLRDRLHVDDPLVTEMLGKRPSWRSK